MSRTEIVAEIDRLIDKLDDSNCRGFMREIGESMFYRSPPRGPGGAARHYSHHTTDKLFEVLKSLRLKKRVKRELQLKRGR